MLNTWIEILCRYAKRWLEGEEIPITENFTKATDEIIEVNDIVKDFVESKLIITKIEMDITARRADRIGKNEMLDLYREMYPKRGITTQLLIPKLRNFKIEYEKGIIGNDGTRGCFVGVKIKNSNDDEEDLTINKLYPALDTKDKDDEIKLLKRKILELEDYITNLKPKEKEIEKVKEDIKIEIKKEILNNNVDEDEAKEISELMKYKELCRKEHKQEKDNENKTISKPKEDNKIITKKSKPKKEKDETVKKGSNQKTKKKYNVSILEIFTSNNIKEMDEIDFLKNSFSYLSLSDFNLIIVECGNSAFLFITCIFSLVYNVLLSLSTAYIIGLLGLKIIFVITLVAILHLTSPLLKLNNNRLSLTISIGENKAVLTFVPISKISYFLLSCILISNSSKSVWGL